jgi:hypothetical protein
MSGAEWSDVFAQVQQDRAGRLEVIVKQLGDFVRAYDRYMLAISGTDVVEIDAATADLDRQYELLDTLGGDRP